MSGTALLTFFECRVCNAAMEGAASGLDVALPNTPSSRSGHFNNFLFLITHFLKQTIVSLPG